MAKKKRNIYLKNKDFLAEIIKCKQNNNTMSPELYKMFDLLITRISRQSNYSTYTYLEDMKAEAMATIFEKWHKFDENRTNNPFAYFTKTINNAFAQCLNYEKKHRNIRDELLVENGLNPSFTYQNDHSKNFEKLDVYEYNKKHKDVNGNEITKPVIEDEENYLNED